MITFNKEKFKTRTFVVKIDGNEQEITIADESLSNKILANDKYLNDDTSEEYKIDNMVYFYVELGQLELSAEEICKDCLDEEVILIREVE